MSKREIISCFSKVLPKYLMYNMLRFTLFITSSIGGCSSGLLRFRCSLAMTCLREVKP